jgi:hypothetical protein
VSVSNQHRVDYLEEEHTHLERIAYSIRTQNTFQWGPTFFKIVKSPIVISCLGRQLFKMKSEPSLYRAGVVESRCGGLRRSRQSFKIQNDGVSLFHCRLPPICPILSSAMVDGSIELIADTRR